MVPAEIVDKEIPYLFFFSLSLFVRSLPARNYYLLSLWTFLPTLTNKNNLNKLSSTSVRNPYGDVIKIICINFLCVYNTRAHTHTGTGEEKKKGVYILFTRLVFFKEF